MFRSSSNNQFRELSFRETWKRYLRDYIERLWDIKQTFAFITLIIFVIDFILKITNPLTGVSAFKTPGFLVNLIGPVLAAIIQFIVSTRYFLQRSSNHLFIQLFSNIIGGVLLGCSVLVAQYYYTHWALTTNEPPAWIAESLHLTNIAFINAIVFTSVPVWYLRPVVSLGQCIGMSIAYIRHSHGMLAWILLRLITNIVFLYVVVWMQSRLRWNQFLKNNELDEWNKVYQAILDKNLSKIAVLNSDGKVMYTNAEFRSLIQSNENEDSLFDSVVNLKLRDSTTYLHTFRDEGFYTQSSKSVRASDKNFRKKISTKETRFNGVHFFDNLSALLEHYRDLLSRDRLQNEDQIIFDGKANSRRSTFVGGKRVNNEPEKIKPKTSLDENEQERHPSKRGSTRVLSVSYEVIIRPLKEYKKLILILNDTTKRDLIANLENDSEYKDKVLASVSHELRTPLNGNLGFLQAAIDDKVLPQNIRERYLIPAWRTGKILYHVIDDILDYSQSHNEGISLKIERKTLRETLDYCYWIYEQAFQEKGLTFLRNFHEQASEIFSTDHERVQRVILNLLSNALKFTPKGSVTMQVDFLKNSRFRITVQDTGEGIDHEDIGKLFEERIFKKRVKGKDLQSKGAGLGLKIAHILAQLLGDENEEGLTVQSALKSGSRFSFEIVEKYEEEEESFSNSLFVEEEDFVIQEENSREGKGAVELMDISNSNQLMVNNFTHVTVPHEHFEEDYEPPSPIPLKDYFKIRMTARTDSQNTNRSEIRTFFEERKNQKVLIVDDDPLNILVLKSFLEQFGVLREGAINGEDAVSKVMTRPFDYCLILMDCQMPVMDGFEATRVLTKKMKSGELPRIPIVGCTAFNGQDKLTECIKTGMEEVISKPVMKEKLKEILKKFTQFREITY